MSDSATTGGSVNPSAFPGTSNAATSLKIHSVLYTSLAIVFVVFFGIF